MIVMYKVDSYSSTVFKAEITKTSDKSVWFSRKRYCSDEYYTMHELKVTQSHRWFDNKDEASEFLLNRLTVKVKSCESRLESAKSELLKFMDTLLKD